jgi:UDP-N-acetylglucosamine--N-acetylmuramyl-(pentapeptide) pyrophosphoryl-undecaprenol N-acetylglucosamine transferase
MTHRKIVFACGGTGGHVYPALALADSFKEMGYEILFIGTKDRIEAKLVPENNYQFESITVQALQRAFTIKNLLFPFRLMQGILQSRKILKRFKADLVVGTGGYVCGPVLYVAGELKIATAIQEQNSYPGLTTRLLMKRVNQVHIAYDVIKKRIKNKNVYVSGNPLRHKIQLIDKSEMKTHFFKNTDITFGILGGSLGAKSINLAISSMIRSLKIPANIYWQTGTFTYEDFKKFSDSRVKVEAYVSNMQDYYSTLDFIICRAGAMSLSEIASLGLPAIIVPYKYASENHQYHNAKVFEDSRAAILHLDDEELEENLQKSILTLVKNPQILTDMSIEMKKMARPNARNEIINKLNELIA